MTGSKGSSKLDPGSLAGLMVWAGWKRRGKAGIDDFSWIGINRNCRALGNAAWFQRMGVLKGWAGWGWLGRGDPVFPKSN